MGSLISLDPATFDAKELAAIIIDNAKVDHLYSEILAEANTHGAVRKKIRIEHFLHHIKVVDIDIFRRVAADPRVGVEAYRHVQKTMTELGVAPDYTIPQHDAVNSSSSMADFRSKTSLSRAASDKARRIAKLNSEKYDHRNLTLNKEEFRAFLPAIYLFSILWEMFTNVDSSLTNYQVNKSEFRTCYKRIYDLRYVSFSPELTKEMWVKEFDVIKGSKKHDALTFRDLCKYMAENVLSPAKFLKLLQNKYYQYDMDKDAGPLGGGLPVKERRFILPTEYVMHNVDLESLTAWPLRLNASIFIEGTEIIERRCRVSLARVIVKGSIPVIEFAADINPEEDLLDATLYGRKSYRLTLPNGLVASQGMFTLLPPATLQPKQVYILRDSVTQQPILADAHRAVVSAKNDPRMAHGSFSMADVHVPIENGRFRLPVESLPNALLTISFSVENFCDPDDINVMVVGDHVMSKAEVLLLNSTFSNAYLDEDGGGGIIAWGKRSLVPSDVSHSPHLELAELPLLLNTEVTIDELGDRKGLVDRRCAVHAVATNKDGKAVIDFETRLKDKVNEFDISLYGKKAFIITHPQSGKRILQGKFTLLPQPSLQPRSTYVIKDANTGKPIEVSANATISSRNDPRNKTGTVVLTKNCRKEVMIVDGILRFPHLELPDGVLTLIPTGVPGFKEGSDFTMVKFKKCIQHDQETILLKPSLPVHDVGSAAFGEVKFVSSADYAIVALKDVKLPQALRSEVKIARTGQRDVHCIVTARAIDKHSRNPIIEFSVDMAPQTNEMDVTIYAEKRTVSFYNPSGHCIMNVSFLLLPNAALQSRSKYVLCSSRDNTSKPIADGGTVTFSISTMDKLRLATEASAAKVGSTTGTRGAGRSSQTAKAATSIATFPGAGSSTGARVSLNGSTFKDVTVDIEEGCFQIPVDRLPSDAVLRVHVSADCWQQFEFSVIMLRSTCQAGHGTIKLKPGVRFSDIDSILTGGVDGNSNTATSSSSGGGIIVGQRITIPASDYASEALEGVMLPTALHATLHAGASIEDPPDTRCELVATAENLKNGQTVIHFQPKVVPGVDELDISLYGKKVFSVTQSRGGECIMKGTFSLFPQASLLPRSSYLLRNCTNNKPVTECGVFVISTKKDKRTAAGKQVMQDLELLVENGTFSLPISQLPDAVITVTPKFEGYMATDFTVIKFADCLQRAEQRLFMNPLLTTPGECRVTLAWGAAPRDLDLHVKTSDGQEVSYNSRSTKSGSAKLDIDVTQGHGPETVTFRPDRGVKYRIFVHNYSGDIELYRSEAVLIFASYDQSHNFDLRISQDVHAKECIYWDCFEMSDSGIPTVVNQVIARSPKLGAF